MPNKPLVFLSWSGDKSKAVAELLHDWIPILIQACDVWVSTQDLTVGKLWREELEQQLMDRVSVGLFVLTKRNQHRPWLIYEYGRLSAQEGTLCPPLCCDLSTADIIEPIGQRNGTTADHDGLLRMLLDIRGHVNADVSEEVFKKGFELQWERIEKDLEEALATPDGGPEDAAPEKSDAQMIGEVLGLVRDNAQRLARIEKATRRGERPDESVRTHLPIDDDGPIVGVKIASGMSWIPAWLVDNIDRRKEMSLEQILDIRRVGISRYIVQEEDGFTEFAWRPGSILAKKKQPIAHLAPTLRESESSSSSSSSSEPDS